MKNKPSHQSKCEVNHKIKHGFQSLVNLSSQHSIYLVNQSQCHIAEWVNWVVTNCETLKCVLAHTKQMNCVIIMAAITKLFIHTEKKLSLCVKKKRRRKSFGKWIWEITHRKTKTYFRQCKTIEFHKNTWNYPIAPRSCGATPILFQLQVIIKFCRVFLCVCVYAQTKIMKTGATADDLYF